MSPRVSCIIPAHNEAPRLGAVLRAVRGHAQLHEVIVVDDGSSDGTLAVAQGFSGVKALSLSPNRGKSRAVLEGLRAAEGELILMLDADLEGLDVVAISGLLAPVLDGRAAMSLSLKANAYPLERALGLEFISGERCFRRSLLGDGEALAGLEGWALESHINRRFLEQGGALAVVAWPRVRHARKSQKRGGFIRGAWGDALAWRQIIRYLGWGGVPAVFAAMWRRRLEA